MEHEVNKIIREKIKEIEKKTIRWGKEEVWNKIGAELDSKSKIPTFYYVAASLTVALAVVIYSLQLSNNKDIDEEIRLLELAIAKSNSGQTTKNTILLSACGEAKYLTITNKKIKRPDPKNKKIATVIQQSYAITVLKNQDSIPTIIPKEEIQIEQAQSVNKKIAVKANRVEPIIGVIIPENKQGTIVKVKKLKFRLFMSPAETDEKTDNIGILFARIN